MNLKWGEIANKLGTISEDLVAPSIPRIVGEEFGLEVIEVFREFFPVMEIRDTKGFKPKEW